MQNEDDNISYCRDMVRTGDSDRYLLSLFSPQPKQRELWALYAFNLELAKIRELVSEPMLGEIRLQWWLEVLDEISEGTVREQPVIQELALLWQYPQTPVLLKALLNSRQADFQDNGVTSFDELSTYASGVGGTLYEAAALVQCGQLSEDAKKVAHYLGASWAMLGLVRALPYYWQKGKGPVTGEMSAGMLSPKAGDAFQLLSPTIHKMMDYVEIYKEKALFLRPKLNSKEKKLLLKSTLINIYQKSLTEVANNPFETIKTEPSDLKKLSRLTWANISGRY